ncbi:unnamed protein product [Penicillium salamii]|uniref:Glycosyl transferase CAP10 domain-containing protein n=1 Tax=Penicillium salamii TaxID=1612424 RepID=A0A9W4JCZ7_9EURO|nr:unnamed protein product [Penicillium salamii]CAG8077065.1 unnamed protein product [Penicillium salamii]CAG8085093.1 unnamed protein product [Penicillium salamii]CAG8094204.1 unnamed protein product [Penicillium salamii]CAG8258973.1 unnamed protein product [Penicillium salamii]
MLSTLTSRAGRVLAFSVFVILGLIWYTSSFKYYDAASAPTTFYAGNGYNKSHPIDALMDTAETDLDELLTTESQDLATAAERYRARRGRHPPPGFAEWFEFAKDKDSLVIEDFFDQIYHDLTPYWALEPKELRRQAKSIPTRISIRNKKAILNTDEPRNWMDSWHDLVSKLEGRLPDLDMPINVMDETRLVVPWETVNEYVLKEQAGRTMPNANHVISEYMSLTQLDQEIAEAYDPEFAIPPEGGYWQMAKLGCPPGSPARNNTLPMIDFGTPPWEFDNFERMSYHGYVGNFTLAKDPCVRPEMQVLHGTFLEPISVSTSNKLLPLFGGSKLPMNNEILLPPAMYWAQNEHYSGGEKEHGGEWEDKMNKAVWRGAATGGRAREPNWTGFQRHRFMSMVNATSVQQAEQNNSHGINFRLPNYADYKLNGDGFVTQLLEQHTDTGFNHLVCTPYNEADPTCPYLDPYFQLAEGMPMKKMYNYKYLPDLDGNSFSGRFRGFMLSTSLPIKATIYNEWHDSRLVPWVHFVPMDTTYIDFYGIMAYFLGGRDSVARKIALAGKAWSEKVLRREDMQIYTYRLLLEYARICDDRREYLGYTNDILGS